MTTARYDVQYRMYPNCDGSETASSGESVSSTSADGNVELEVNEHLQGGSSGTQQVESIADTGYPRPAVGLFETASNMKREQNVAVVERCSDGVTICTPPRFPSLCSSFQHDVDIIPPCLREESIPTKHHTTGASGTDDQAVNCAFGIAYEPQRQRRDDEGYDLLEVPSFGDEEEFEELLSAEFRVGMGKAASAEKTPAHPTAPLTGKNNEGSGVTPFSHDEDGAKLHSLGNAVAHDHQQRDTDTIRTLSGRPQGDHESMRDGVTSRWQAQAMDASFAPNEATHIQEETSQAQGARSAAYSTDRATIEVDSCEVIGGDDEGSGSQMMIKNARNGQNLNLSGIMSSSSVFGRQCDGLTTGQFCTIAEEDEEGQEDIRVVKNSSRRKEQLLPRSNKSAGEEATNEHTRVAREWANIDQLRAEENSAPMERGVGGVLQPTCVDEQNKSITTTAVLAHLRSQYSCKEVDAFKDLVVPTETKKQRWNFLRRPVELAVNNGQQHRDEVFLIAQNTKINYDPAEVVHYRLIQTIYRRMTGNKRTCPEEGPHWGIIGFQGNDPRTDLNRSMGIFSLVQNAVGALRRGACNGECNRKGKVTEVVHELHQAQFYTFLELCRREPATHHALHISKVCASSEKNPLALVKAYRAHLADEKRRHTNTMCRNKLEFGDPNRDSESDSQASGQKKTTGIQAISSRRHLYMTTETSC